jgi:glutathione S-transferase
MFWRHAHPFTAALLTQFKDFGESNRETYNGAQKWLNRELEGREFLVGDSLTMADICLLSTVDFADWIGLPVLEEYEHLAAWRARMKARPSADA